jgi:hypothetical protein
MANPWEIAKKELAEERAQKKTSTQAPDASAATNPWAIAKQQLAAERQGAAPAAQESPWEIAKRERAAENKSLVGRGVDFVKDTISDSYDAGVGAVKAGGKLAGNVARGDVFTDENAGLAADVLEGGFKAALPLAPLALGAGVATVGAVPTLAGVAAGGLAGYVGSQMGRKGAAALGASENVQRLAGEVGGMAGGGMAGKMGVQAAARRMAARVASAPVAATGAPSKAAQYVAQRLDEVDTIKGAQRRMFQGDKSRRSKVEQMMDQWMDSSSSSLGRIEDMAKANQGGKQEISNLMTKLENFLAVGRRPDAPQVATAEAVGLETALRGLAKHPEWSKATDRFLAAYRENADVKLGRITADKLPGGGGAKRLAENAEIIKEYGPKFQEFAKTLDNFVEKGIQDTSVFYGLISPDAKTRMGVGHGYVKWKRPLTPVEEEALMATRGERVKPALGKGKRDATPFLEEQLELREPENVIQATLDQAQQIHRDGALNMALQELAKYASKWNPKTKKVEGGGMLKDLILVKGTEKGKVFQSLSPETKAQTGWAPVMIKGEEYQLMGPPATLNAFNSVGQVGANVAFQIVPLVSTAIKTAARFMKMTTTGPLAAARKGVNMVYNVGAVYQQMPLAVTPKILAKQAQYTTEFLLRTLGNTPVIGKVYKGSKRFRQLRKEGLEMSATGTSSEILRGVGEQNADYLASKGSLPELFKFVVAEPLREAGKAVTGQKYKPEVVKRVLTAADDLLRTWEDLYSADEFGLKMAVFDVMQKYHANKGMTAEMAKHQAAWDARNVIADFTRRGNNAPIYDLVGAPYLQAALTGIRTNWMFARKDPMGFALRSAAPIVGHMMINAGNYADPRKAAILKDVPVDQQARNMVFFTGEPVTKNERGQYASGLLVVPLPESPFIRALAAGNIALLKNQTQLQNAATFATLWSMGKHGFPVEPDVVALAANVPILGPMSQIAADRDVFSGATITSPRAQRNAPAWAVAAAGGDRKLAAQIKYGLSKAVPGTRYIEEGPPDENDDGLGIFRYGVREFQRPFTRLTGGQSRRDLKDKR